MKSQSPEVDNGVQLSSNGCCFVLRANYHGINVNHCFHLTLLNKSNCNYFCSTLLINLFFIETCFFIEMFIEDTRVKQRLSIAWTNGKINV